MSKKWGESFLKTGLPLEHLVGTILRNAGWSVNANPEYQRKNASGEPAWFSIDLEAYSGRTNRDTELGLLIECKYHDDDRFWMFLPSDEAFPPTDGLICNCQGFDTLQRPDARTLIGLAPLISRGTVISRHGLKQDDAVHAAIQQIVNGYLPILLTQVLYISDVREG